MKSTVSQLEIEKAKNAAIGFIRTVFLERKFGGYEFQNFANEIQQFSRLEPTYNCRKVGGKPMIFMPQAFGTPVVRFYLDGLLHIQLQMVKKIRFSYIEDKLIRGHFVQLY